MPISHSMLIRELFKEGDVWRITIAELTSGHLLGEEMFPYGVPYGITIREDVMQDAPEVVGSFLIGGLNSDVLQHMAEDYAQKFRDAGLTPAPNPLAMEGAPEEGMVRTWLQGIDTPWDMPLDEAVELYADNWIDVELPESLTVWEPIATKTITFKYANGMTYPVPLTSIEQSQMPAARLLNHSNFLVIPADESLNPVLSGRTVPNMFGLRVDLELADAEFKRQQIEIGFLVYEFAKIIKKYTATSWKNPVGVFRDGLGKR